MIKAGIVGGTGYTGVELLRLLAQHPDHRHEGGRKRDLPVSFQNAEFIRPGQGVSAVIPQLAVA